LHKRVYIIKQIQGQCSVLVESVRKLDFIWHRLGKLLDYDRVSRFALVFLYFFCIVGSLHGIVFNCLNVNDRKKS